MSCAMGFAGKHGILGLHVQLSLGRCRARRNMTKQGCIRSEICVEAMLKALASVPVPLLATQCHANGNQSLLL